MDHYRNTLIRGPLFDGHIHLFPDKMMRAVFKYFRDQYGWLLPFQPSPAALAEYLRGQNVSRALALAYVHKPDLSRAVNNWLADFTAGRDWLVPFGSVHPLDRDLDLVLKEALDIYGFPGLKLHCLVQGYRPDDEKLFPIYEFVLERSRAVVIHAGSFPVPAEERLGLRYISRLLRRYPGLNLIIPHLGLYEMDGFAELLPLYPGLHLDTAFVFQNKTYDPPVDEILELIHRYPDRIIYGSDFPFIQEDPRYGLGRILELGLTEELLGGLFFDNAARFLSRLKY